MLAIDQVDLDELAGALEHQVDYGESCWLIDPKSGQFEYWTRDCGIDGFNPVDLDELCDERGLIGIDPLPSYVWYEDMADFAAGVSDEKASGRLERAIRGRGAFRRFKDELHEEYPELLTIWHRFHDVRAKRRAVEWLLDNKLVSPEDADRYFGTLDEPALP